MHRLDKPLKETNTLHWTNTAPEEDHNRTSFLIGVSCSFFDRCNIILMEFIGSWPIRSLKTR